MNNTKNNKLIAEFMGEKFTDSSGVVQGLNYKLIERKHGIGNNGFRFHTSWDWLMPVVEKIETVSTPEDKGVLFVFDINQTQVSWHLTNGYGYNNELSCIQGSTKIEATYKAVVEFIKWYNSNK